MKDIYKFANELFNSSGLTVNPSHDIHDLCKEIKINSDAIENIDDDKLESLSELGLSISSDLDIQDIWKYAAIFYTLNELVGFDCNENVQSTASELSGSWEDAVTILSTKISETNITSDADEKDITDLVDYIIGCMFLGVEAALTDADDEGIEAWVMGFGNPFEYDDPVGDIIMSLDSSIREDLSDTYMQALLSLYFVDVDDYRDDDEGVDWDQVSDHLKQLM
jgi:hypothetical protein|tara:strand:+ start:54 stop:722 length:669 start_codon:yes stop_codon:yes gene_type:complete